MNEFVTKLEELIALGEKYLVPTYRRLPVAFVKGAGCWLEDSLGRKYLDFLSGIAVNNLGYAHPKFVAALKDQIEKLIHTSNLYQIEPQARLAEILIKHSFPGKVFFSNSGAEANEAAIKLVRKWGQPQGRSKIITALQSFHGRTLTTISATGQPKYQKSFTPLTPGFAYVPYDNLTALGEAIDKETAAVMLEVVQGEGGYNIPHSDYLRMVRQLCNERGVLLVLDEVQTGIGRTGKLFAYEHTGITPDVMTLAKGLGNGVPIGATVVAEAYADVLQPGDHAATFGGNFLSSRAALTTIEIILSENLCALAASRGEYLLKGLKRETEGLPIIKDIKGLGLMVRLELNVPGQQVVDACLERGLILNCIQGNVLRFIPPLIVTNDEIDQALAILKPVLEGVRPDET